MDISKTESNFKLSSDNFRLLPLTDRAARRLAEKFAIPIGRAKLIIFLAGIGSEREARS
jgi:hypothetical protein